MEFDSLPVVEKWRLAKYYYLFSLIKEQGNTIGRTKTWRNLLLKTRFDNFFKNNDIAENISIDDFIMVLQSSIESYHKANLQHYVENKFSNIKDISQIRKSKDPAGFSFHFLPPTDFKTVYARCLSKSNLTLNFINKNFNIKLKFDLQNSFPLRNNTPLDLDYKIIDEQYVKIKNTVAIAELIHQETVKAKYKTFRVFDMSGKVIPKLIFEDLPETPSIDQVLNAANIRFEYPGALI